MEWFWNAYLPEGAIRDERMISPLSAEQTDLAHFALTLVITDEHDVLRDEGELFADKLVMAGVDVTATRYLHTIHDFVVLNAINGDPQPQAAIEQAAGFLRDHLVGAPSE